MPFLLLFAVLGAVGAAAAVRSTTGNPSGGGVPPAPPLPPVQFMRAGHRYWLVFQVNRAVNDPSWWALASQLHPSLSNVPLPDAAGIVLQQLLESVGFVNVSSLCQDQVCGRSSSPIVWRMSADWAGTDGEPVEHLYVLGPDKPTTLIWQQIQDLGVPQSFGPPLAMGDPTAGLLNDAAQAAQLAMMVSGAPPAFASAPAPWPTAQALVGGPHMGGHHGGHHHGGRGWGGPWYGSSLCAWPYAFDPWGNCVYVGG